ncbi:MAG: type II toxin-antitoxin system Phd/YefM family antitoxin [Streptococcaceae bacterium]|jgi:PHD/YefM family antitoxin component YafN of YafNO toxin-antitoxin module|nr:type II toxin-antitoxin system Phd/YefM family antitoxin [Streptococcaceae bacterium]MCH4176690.1 type II toxin-antitoxin system Phd/YefM family antitoxin [Streptococcaceae bacterium]
METVTPTNARKNLYNIIKKVTSSSIPMEITSTKDENESVVMISKSDWNAIQETLYLQNTGVLDRIHQFEDEETEVLGDIDWSTL